MRDAMQDQRQPIWGTPEGRAMLAIYAGQVIFLAALGCAVSFFAFD